MPPQTGIQLGNPYNLIVEPILTRNASAKRAADALAKQTPKVSKQRTSKSEIPEVIRVVPDLARVNILSIPPGHSVKQGTRIVIMAKWNVSYEAFLAVVDDEAKTDHPRFKRGLWTTNRMIGVFSRPLQGQPKQNFDSDRQWLMIQNDYQHNSLNSSKEQEIRLIYTFKAATTVTSDQSDQQRVVDTVEDETDDDDDMIPSQRDTTPISSQKPRQSVTNKRVANLSDDTRRLGVIMEKIKDSHACKKCAQSWCYNPLSKGPHCEITHGGLYAWAQMIQNNEATYMKPHSSLPELVAWETAAKVQFDRRRKDESIATPSPSPVYIQVPHYASMSSLTSPSASVSRQSPSTNMSASNNNNSSNNSYNESIDLPSSPPCGDGEDDEMHMLARWIQWTIERYPIFKSFEPAPVIAQLEGQYLGWHSVKGIVLKPGIEHYGFLRECGLPLGLAEAMHKELYRWEKSVKEAAKRDSH